MGQGKRNLLARHVGSLWEVCSRSLGVKAATAILWGGGLLMLAGVAIGAKALLTAALPATGWPMPLSPGSRQPVRTSETRIVVMRTYGFLKQVVIDRQERESPSAPWAKQHQVLTTSFPISSAKSRCDEEIWVAGSAAPQNATIERWALHHPMRQTGSGQYIALDQRRLPEDRRSTFYSGSDYGYVADLAVDPEGRFLLLLFVSFDGSSKRLYQWHLPIAPPPSYLGPPVLLADSASLPELSLIEQVSVAQHESEGRKYVLSSVRRGTDVWVAADVITILLSDPENDGVLSPPIVFTAAEWAAAGYKSEGAWSQYFSVCD